MDCFEGNIATLRCIPFFLQQIINVVSILSVAAALCFIIWGGIRFITSGGDQLKMATAKKTVSFAIIGLAILLLSFVILKLVSTISGVDCKFLGVKC